MVKISVITVCYNSVQTIEQTILSIKNQTHKDVEHIIIDGGSTDGTQEIVRRYVDDTVCFISEPDNGIYDAMNKGLLYASGDVISILNSDDWYEEDTLEKVNAYFQKGNFDILVGNVNQVIEERVFCSEIRVDCIEEIHFKMVFPHPGMFVKRDVYERVGMFSLKYQIAADYDWTLRAYNAGVEFLCVSDVFANFRMNGISTTHAYQAKIEGKEIALRNMGQQESAELVEKIKNYYDEGIEKNKSSYVYQMVWKEEIEYIKSLLDMDSEYYIWGTGLYGEMCYELFEALGVKIAGFMDNHIQQNEIHNYTVIQPHKLKNSEKICVATPKYEREIVEQLKQMEIAANQYILFSEIQQDVASNIQIRNKYQDILDI